MDIVGAVSRRTLLTGAAAAGLAAGEGLHEWLNAGGTAAPSPAVHAARPGTGLPPAQSTPMWKGTPIGDGSTWDTGPQPNQPVPQRMEPGRQPPQFVVFSWDGAGQDDRQLFSRFRKVAQDTGATMTFNLSGIYLLPEGKKDMYAPPGKPVGASAIGYLKDEHIRATLGQLRAAWLEGHEIATHFNGHFCDANGVGTWTPDQWRDEINQAISFVQNWRTNTGFTDVDPLPFDYAKELSGSRTPCLLGQDQLLPTAKALGWTYDTSSPGEGQWWPAKRGGLWNFPLQQIPFPGHSFEVLSMDYNILANQAPNADINGDPALRPMWKQQAVGSYLAGFQRAYTTNRAPYHIGNHFEGWNGGIYMDAVEEALRQMADQPDVHLVSFRQLAQWLDAQDPSVLAKLRTLDVGEKPNNWADYTTPPAPPAHQAPAHV